MIQWNQHKRFSPEFLSEHHDLLVYDIYHQIKAFTLYPLNCSCKERCQCADLRTKVSLSLNVELYNRAFREGKDPETLSDMRFFLSIPDDSYFREHHGESYPLWLIEKEWEDREEQNHFKIVAQLVWTLLRLSKTQEVSPWRNSQASVTEALKELLPSTPLKKKGSRKEEGHLCGEKAYRKYLKTYKSVCHFIAALEYLREDKLLLSPRTPRDIKKFLEVSDWFRTKLLSFLTPNVKEMSFFLEEELLPLPPWVNGKDVKIPLQPLEKKLQAINDMFANAQRFPQTGVSALRNILTE